MSYFSQFTGTQVPIGGTITAPQGLYQNNPTISGSEYLYLGILKPYTSTYAAFAAALPPATIQTATTSGVWSATTGIYGAPGQGARLEKGGSYYYQFMFWAGGNQYADAYIYGPSITSSPTATVNNGATNAGTGNDSLTFNGNAIYTWSQNIYSGNSAVSSGALQNRYTESVAGFNWLAASPTTAIAVRGNVENFATATSGFVKTSTNGTTWTNRTISITGAAAAETVSRVTWSTVGNCFIFVGSAGSIYTSPDGYTLTKRTTPSGMPATVSGSYVNNSLCANSSTATLISLGGLTGLNAGPYVLKTTDGTTFTVIDLSTASGLFGAYSYNPSGVYPLVPQIAWDTTTSKFVIACCSIYYYTGGQILAIAYSTNDGASWTLDSVKALTNGRNGFFGMNSTSDGNFFIGIGLSDQNSTKYVTPSFVNNKIGNGTPDYVGSGTATGQFIRIA